MYEVEPAKWRHIEYVMAHLHERNKLELMADGTVWSERLYSLTYLLSECAYAVVHIQDAVPACIFGAQRLGSGKWHAWMLETAGFDGLAWRCAARGFKRVMQEILKDDGPLIVQVPTLRINIDAARFCQWLGATQDEAAQNDYFVYWVWQRADLERWVKPRSITNSGAVARR